MQKSLILTVVPVSADETNKILEGKVKSYFANILSVTDVGIDVTHCFGTAFKDLPKHVIVRFASLRDREGVLRAKEGLKNHKPPPPPSPIKLSVDKSKITRDRDNISYKIVNRAQKLDFIRSAV